MYLYLTKSKQLPDNPVLKHLNFKYPSDSNTWQDGVFSLIKGDIKMITGCLYDAILGMAKKMQTPVCMCLFTL